MFSRVALGAGVLCAQASAIELRQAYSASVVEFDSKPILSFVDGTSTFAQVFNPSWVEATALTNHTAGLLVRTQNCTGCGVGYDPVKAPDDSSMCCSCAGTDANASRITFSRMIETDHPHAAPRFSPITADSEVFGPHNASDLRGTEDPRIQYDEWTNLYYMFYTCWSEDFKARLCLATSTNPTTDDKWTRRGLVFGSTESKSAALLPPSLRRPQSVGSSTDSQPLYTMIHGAGKISYTESENPLEWDEFGSDFITNVSWSSGGGNNNVEAGPPPMKLSDGNLIFFFNSWCGDETTCPESVPPPGYQPVWVRAPNVCRE